MDSSVALPIQVPARLALPLGGLACMLCVVLLIAAGLLRPSVTVWIEIAGSVFGTFLEALRGVIATLRLHWRLAGEL